MAKWIGDARRAAENDEDVVLPEEPGLGRSQAPSVCWQATLKKLFGGLPKSKRFIPPAEYDAEAARMETLAEMAEDEIPDDGAIEADSDDAYGE